MRWEPGSVSFEGMSSRRVWFVRFVALLALAGAAGGCASDNPSVSQGTVTATSAAITFGTVNLPATTATLNITLPPLTAGEQAGLAFGARNALTIDGRLSTTGLGASAATVVMGNDGTVGALTATGAVTIGDRSHVTGALRTGATASLGSQATAGSVQQHLTLPPTTFTNTTVAIPAATRNATAAPNEVATLAPGSYGQVTINAGARITLTAGTYNLRGLDLEPQAQLIVTGPVTVNVTGSLVFRGAISDGGDATRFRLFYFGTSAVRFDTPFRGRVIAPAASIVLAAGSAITGFCYAASLEVSDSITWTPISSPLGGIVATPTLTATGVTFSATQGVSFSGVVAHFTDSVTTDTTANFTASINWGDGTTSAGTVGGASGMFTVSGAHTYAATGTFAVTVTITQTPSGVTAVATSTANVGRQLAASGVMFSATQGVPFTGQVATFTDAVTTDTAASFTASINWGDGTTSPGMIGGASGMFTVSGTHTYVGSGTFAVTVTITDTANGATATATSTGLVGAQLSASGVMFTATQSVSFTGLVANLHDANTSDTAASFTATIAWGDGSTSAGAVAGGGGTFTISGTHTYASAGTFTVTVSIVDSTDAASATATSTALVGRELTATGVTFNATAGVAFTGTVANLTDANTSHAASSFTASIAWGDGGTSAGVVGGANGTFTVSGTHTYASAGTFTVTVSITNTASGATATATSTAIVSSTLSATGLTFTAVRGVSFTGVVANLTDTNASDPASAFTASIAWGDGSVSTGTITGGSGAFTISGTHTYAATGTFNVTISVSQTATGLTATAVSTALVGTELGAIGINITALVGVSFTGAVASVTDTDATHTAATFTATISWGDGATSAGTITGSAGQFTVAGTHTYATTGTFNVTVSITNTASGATATTTSIATVVSPIEFQSWGVTFTAAPGVSSSFQGTLVAHVVDGNPAASGALTGTADWGDGSTPSAVFFVQTPLPGNFDVIGNHTFLVSGTFNVTVSITDTSNGATTNATSIAQVAPQLLATGKTFAGTPGVIMNDVLIAHVSDTNPTDNSASLNATVDWGDGSPPQNATVAPSGPPGSFDVLGNHTFTASGTFTIHVTIAAQGGATATATSTAVVGPQLAVTGVTFNASPGVSFSGQVIGHLSDTDLGDTATAFTATVDWGDGTPGTVGVVSTPAPGVFDLTGSHIYLTSGTFTVQISVTRTGNNASASGSSTALVASSIAGAGADTVVPPGVSRQILVAHVTDTNPGDANALTAVIDWGDGSSASQGTVLATEAAGVFDVLASHTYRTEATFTTTTTVTGPGGASVALIGSAIVSPEPLVDGITFNATAGVVSTVLLGHLMDPNPLDTASSFFAGVDWNDGSGALNNVTVTATDTPGVFNLVSGHTFSSTGTFNPILHVSRLGSSVDLGTREPVANVVAPSDIPALFASGAITQSQPNAPPAGSGFLVASFVDADPSEPTSSFSVTIDWGDGTTSSTAGGSSIVISPVTSPPGIPAPAGTFNVFSPHTYTTSSIFTVNVTISSSASGASTSTTSFVQANGAVVAASTVIRATPGATPPFPGFLVASFTDEIPFLLPNNYDVFINWGDGTPPTTSALIVPVGAGGNQYDVFAPHSYASFGTFPVFVDISSHFSGAGGIAHSTAILSQPLHASGTTFNAFPNVTPPSPGFLVASVVDDDLVENASDLSVTVDWGDGSPASSTPGGVSVTLAGPPGSGLFDVFSPHSYAHPGTFPVTVTITSAVSKGSATVTSVASAAQQLVASGTAISAVPGIAPAVPGFVVASFVDSNTTEGAPQFDVTVDWGDGTPVSTTPLGVFVAPATPSQFGGTFDVFAPHTYATSGTFPITVTITSTSTGVSTTTTSTAQVTGKLLATGAVLRAGLAAPLPPGAGGTVVASVIDSGVVSPVATLSATIDWGDGSPPTTTGTTTNGVFNDFLLTGVPGTFDLASTHAYASAGTFNATITITDTSEAPATTTTTAKFTVLP